MKFTNPEIEVVKFNVVDVITASGDTEETTAAPSMPENQTPIG